MKPSRRARNCSKSGVQRKSRVFRFVSSLLKLEAPKGVVSGSAWGVSCRKIGWPFAVMLADRTPRELVTTSPTCQESKVTSESGMVATVCY